MGLPESTQAMFITEALHDMKEIIKALGGDKNTILSFAGFGDLLLTATSIKSRNFRFGKMIGEENPKEIIEQYKNNTTIEGLYTLKSIYKLLDTKKVNIPIINLVYDIVFNDKNPNEIKEFLIKKYIISRDICPALSQMIKDEAPWYEYECLLDIKTAMRRAAYPEK